MLIVIRIGRSTRIVHCLNSPPSGIQLQNALFSFCIIMCALYSLGIKAEAQCHCTRAIDAVVSLKYRLCVQVIFIFTTYTATGDLALMSRNNKQYCDIICAYYYIHIISSL